jgi:predicted esterase
MKKIYAVLPVLLTIILSAMTPAYAQSGVLNPNDTLVSFNPNTPPSSPPNDNNIYKWGRTSTLRWNTSAWKAYYYNGIAFRIIFPPDYLTNPAKTFPLLVFFHGEGERGPVYNNELQLANCGSTITTNVLNSKFDGFVIFPQSTYGGWTSSQFITVAGFIDSMINEVRVDPNRIIASGLSSGGDGTWKFTAQYPNLVAAATPISAATAQESSASFINTIKDIPIWLSQGGLDNNPKPALTTGVVNTMVDSGMDIQTVAPGQEGQGKVSEGYYIIYPNNAHNTWDAHYNEPQAWSYMMRAYKSNPHVYDGKRLFCRGDAINVKLELTPGFGGYQWANNGVVIPGATTNSITVTDTGTYSARILNGGVWSDWSHWPAHITYNNPNAKTPSIEVAGLMSRVIPAPDGNTSVNLTLPPGYYAYQWRNSTGQVVSSSQTYTALQPGGFVATIAPTQGCTYLPSDTFVVASNSGPNPPDAAVDLNAYPLSETSVQLTWSRNLHPINKETGFEIYRATQSGGPYQFIGLVPADTVSFTDNNLTPNTQYIYIVRAIDSSSAAPVSKQDSVVTFLDKQPPTAPGNLMVLGASTTSITLQWNPSTDNVFVQNYYVYINGVRTYVTPNTIFTINNLTYKQYYTFTVKAVDPSGNISSPSNQIVASAVERGLTYYYYTFTGNWGSIPNLSTLPVIDSGIINNVSLVPATQTSNFAFAFKGYINIRKAGVYTFYTNSDDGSNLYINGTKVVNNDGQHGAQQKSGTYTFSQTGIYPFEVDYFQQGGGYSLATSWQASGIGIPMSTIPDSAFTETNPLQGNPPAMPAGVNATASSYNTIKLNWTDNSNNETGFEIYRGGSGTGPWQIVYTTKANITSYTDSTLSPVTSYFYEVQAINQYGSSGFAPQTKYDSATTWALPPVPSAPGNLTATSVSTSQIHLTWNDPSQQVTGYNIYRSDGNNSNFRQLKQLPAGSSSYADSSLFSNTTYYYQITAANLGGTSANSNAAFATTFNLPPAITAIPDQYIPYDTTWKINVSAIDSDGDAVTFSATNLPSFASLQDNGNGTGILSFSPSSSQAGGYPGIKVFATDQYGAKDSTTFTLFVSSNQPPVIQPVPPLQVSTFTSVMDTVSLSNPNPDDPVHWKITGMPSFVDTASDGLGHLMLEIQPGATDAGSYSFQVVAINNSGGNDQITVNLTVTYVPLKKWYLNFATNFGYKSYPGSPWNNVRGDTVTNLTDDQGNNSSVGLQLQTNWWATRMDGGQTGNNSGVYSDTVMRDEYYFGILGGPNTVTGAVRGLDTAKTYNITLFASSTWQITPDNGYTVYQIGSHTDSIEVQNNTSKTVTFPNIKPAANGSITFTMSKGLNAKAGYINAMVISTNANIPPSTLLNLQINSKSTGGNNAVQLKWETGSNNTDTVAIYRSTHRGGPYTLVNPGVANDSTTSYVDTTVSSLSVTYYYYVVAANAYGRSAASDTLFVTTSQYVDKRQWYINFASSYGWLSYPGSPWNNVRSDTAANLTDNQGNNSSVGLQLHTNWWAAYTNGAQTGNNSGVYSDTVLRDYYYFGISGGPNTVTGSVTGLDTSKTYSLTFFASSVWQIRPDNGYTDYQIGSRKDSIYVQNNTNRTVTFSNVKPVADGSIPFTMSKGLNATAGYINAIVISTDTKALPAKPLNVLVSNQATNGNNTVLVNWTLGSTNANTIKVYRSTTPNANYILLDPDTLNGYQTSFSDVKVTTGNTYYYYLVASNDYGSSAFSDTVSITIPQYVDNRQWYINFATNYGYKPYPGIPWNNIRSDTAMSLTDDQGNSSHAGIQLYTNWWGTRMDGAQTGNGTGVYSDTVMRDDYYFGVSGGPNVVTGAIVGLDTSKLYGITFFGSSNWQITRDNGYTVYQVGLHKDSIEVQNNTNKTIIFPNIKPAADGSITFTMSKGLNASAGYINAMVVSTYSSFPPATPLNFNLTNEVANGGSAVQLSWQPGSNNTDTVKIYRSTSKTGTYTLLNPGLANGDSVSYTDSGVLLGGTYYYYLVAVNTYGNSQPTDTLDTIITNFLPAKPLNVQLSNIVTNNGNTNAVNANWQQGSSNADTIQVYRSINKNGNYTLLNPGLANGSSTSYTDTTISLGTSYYYYLVAVNNYGNSGPTDTVNITTNGAPLSPPTMSVIPTAYVFVGLKDTIPVSASAGGANVTFSLQNAPSFVSVQSTGDSSAVLILAPRPSDYGYYDSVKVVAHAVNGTSSSEYFNIYVTKGGLSDAIYLNFTDAAHAYSQIPWNNINYNSGSNNQFNKLMDIYGQSTGASVNISNAWSGYADLGGNTYNNSGFVPDSVMGSYYYVSDATVRTIQLSGLDTGMRYNLVFFGSSYNESNSDYTTNYTVNGQTVTLNGISNTSNAVRINGIQPDSTGRIIVFVAKGANAAQGILNAMILESYSNGTIVAPANLSAVASTSKISLTWSDRSNNEQQFQIWRSTAANGTYTDIMNVPANITTFNDNGVAADTRYF